MQKRGYVIFAILVLVGVFLLSVAMGKGYYSYQKTEGDSPLSKKAGQGAGWKLYSSGSFEEAMDEFTKQILADNNNFEAYLGAGKSSLMLKEFSSAEKYFSAATLLKKKNFDSQAGLGEALYSQGKFDQAAMAFQKAIKIDSSKPQSWEGLGKSYLHLGRYDEAKAVFQFMQDHFESSVSPVGLFLSTYGEGNMEEAQKRLEEMWPHLWVMKSKPDERFVAFMECAIPMQKDATHVFECGKLL